MQEARGETCLSEVWSSSPRVSRKCEPPRHKDTKPSQGAGEYQGHDRRGWQQAGPRARAERCESRRNGTPRRQDAKPSQGRWSGLEGPCDCLRQPPLARGAMAVRATLSSTRSSRQGRAPSARRDPTRLILTRSNGKERLSYPPTRQHPRERITRDHLCGLFALAVQAHPRPERHTSPDNAPALHP